MSHFSNVNKILNLAALATFIEGISRVLSLYLLNQAKMATAILLLTLILSFIYIDLIFCYLQVQNPVHVFLAFHNTTLFTFITVYTQIDNGSNNKSFVNVQN